MKLKKYGLMMSTAAIVLTLAACNDKEEESAVKKVESKGAGDITEGVELKVSDEKGETINVDNETLAASDFKVLNKDGLSWFTPVENVVAFEKARGNAVAADQMIEVKMDGSDSNEKILSSGAFTFLGIENVSANYSFSKQLTFFEPTDPKNPTSDLKTSYVALEGDVLSRIVYTIPGVTVADLVAKYEAEYGAANHKDENMATFANETTTISIVPVGDAVSIIYAPADYIVRDVAGKLEAPTPAPAEGTPEGAVAPAEQPATETDKK